MDTLRTIDMSKSAVQAGTDTNFFQGNAYFWTKNHTDKIFAPPTQLFKEILINNFPTPKPSQKREKIYFVYYVSFRR